MKFYVGEQVEVDYAYEKVIGTVTGFYEDGKPRIVDLRGHPYAFPDYLFTEPGKFAIIKASEERKKVEAYFNDRSFVSRLVYLFTKKMP